MKVQMYFNSALSVNSSEGEEGQNNYKLLNIIKKKEEEKKNNMRVEKLGKHGKIIQV